MKTHTSGFKEQIKLIGKEIDSKITFGNTVLGKNDLNAVTPSYQGAILKSVMKQLDIDSNVAIPIGTILTYEFGLKVNGEYEYINYGNYVVYSIEKQEDTNSYKITCYDKLLYSMLDYVKLPITYPISIRDYINTISTTLGLKFANKSGTFANYNKQIQADLYDGLGYTFRDVLDELAQVTASTICLNNNDELEIRYITETGDTIDEEFLKDVNVNFGEKFGAVNTIVLSRSAGSDNIYYPTVLPTNPYEIKISDNQIMNGNDRADFLPDIYNKLNGLEFYTNDFVSTGILYYDLCDRYSVKIGDTTYSCVMFNDEVLVTQGLEENIYTELPEQTKTDYKKADTTDRRINQAYAILDKQNKEFEVLVSEVNSNEEKIGSLEITTGNISTKVSSVEKDLSTTNTNLSNLSGKVNTLSDDIDGVSADFEEFKDNEYIQSIDNLQKQIDGAIQFWNGAEIPTLNNYPANEWTTENDKINHQADIYTVVQDVQGEMKQGKSYRFDKVGGVWQWIELTDNELSAVQAIAQEALDKAKVNATEIGTVKTKVSSLEQTDEQIKASVESIDKQIIPTASVSDSNIYVKDASTNPLTYLEIEGKSIQDGTPAPDTPVEIESVGYENLLNFGDTEKTLYDLTTNIKQSEIIFNGTKTVNSNTIEMTSIGVYKAGIYTFSLAKKSGSCSSLSDEFTLWKGTKREIVISLVNGTYNYSFTLTEDTELFYQYWVNSGSTYNNYAIGFQLTKGTQHHSYIPYGKYGIEAETVGKNYLNAPSELNVTTFINIDTDIKSGTYKITLDSINTNSVSSAILLQFYKGDSNVTAKYFYINSTEDTITLTSDVDVVRVYSGSSYNESLDKTATITNLMISKSGGEYQPYQKNTSLIVLNEPLRSLPNGVKDIAYIKNNKLYVDRYVGNLVLNGDENFEEWYCLNPNNTYGFKLMSIDNIKVLNDPAVYVKMLMSNHFKQLGHQDYLYVNDVENISSAVGNLYFRIARNKATSISEVKAWFRSNNTQVDYELAETYTEELGEIEMLKTLKGYNDISTTDELLPIINLTYVRDTIIADYVENHVAELKLTENEIKASVESVSSSVDGLNTTINRVEEITTDNSQVINVISTNIDKSTGEVREVTTTTGFTFNADGMTIDDGSGFKAEHTADGTYYKDGNSIVGQYTKDGSKQKDLELFGTYSYGKESIDDTPMFIGQLYRDENGEECFGHFVNI